MNNCALIWSSQLRYRICRVHNCCFVLVISVKVKLYATIIVSTKEYNGLITVVPAFKVQQPKQFRALNFSVIAIVLYCYQLQHNRSFVLLVIVLQPQQFNALRYSSVLSVIEQQIEQLSAFSYSTIATIVQCFQLQYNSYRSLGAILRIFL